MDRSGVMERMATDVRGEVRVRPCFFFDGQVRPSVSVFFFEGQVRVSVIRTHRIPWIRQFLGGNPCVRKKKTSESVVFKRLLEGRENECDAMCELRKVIIEGL